MCDRAAVADRFDRGPEVRVPVTVAFGDADRVLPPDSSQERSLLPAGARWVDVADCGHAMTWDQAETCLGLIRRTAVGYLCVAGGFAVEPVLGSAARICMRAR